MDSFKAQSHGPNQEQRCLSRVDRPLVYPTFLLSSMQTPVCMEFICQSDIQTNIILNSSILASLKHPIAVRIPACSLISYIYISSDLGREFEKISNQQTHKVTTLTTHNSSLPWLCSPAAIFQCLLLRGHITAYHVWIVLESLSLPEFIRKET